MPLGRIGLVSNGRPALPLDAWRDTCETLHMWTQVVGKVCLALTPKSNHFWNVALAVGARGLVTPVMRSGHVSFEMSFNFVDHRLDILCADGGARFVPLEPMSVAEFYRRVMSELRGLGVDVKIWTMPVEVPDPIRFTEDTVHVSYDRDRAQAFWHALLLIKPIFEDFRCDFLGKCSPVHFFWGSFDLAVTRFSGRRAPARPEMGPIYEESYSHEVISHGFWPGSGPVQEPAFYAYAVPQPAGFADAEVEPTSAYYHTGLSEFILPYEAVRAADSPERELGAFLASTYEAGARLGGWNRADLERS